ncbi:MAG: hypothetical protein BroJett040_14820 [Oligoflexia bacterium]|nr:MAG: hypothetical protein BroJett040_14820 [Oligoflexia bacterium]
MKKIVFLILLGIVGGCATKVLKVDKEQESRLKENREFEQSIQIVAVEEVSPSQGAVLKAPTEPTPETKLTPEKARQKPVKEKKKALKPAKVKEAVPPTPEVPTRRQPELESDVGFDGRRPIKDPFRVGEKVVHSVNYFKMKAGTLTLEVKPYAQVNGRKSYNWKTSIATSPFFESFHAVDDYSVTMVDYETLVPYVYTLHVKETGKLLEARALFDREKSMATYWEKKVTDKDGEQEKKHQWEIPDYSQNVFSAAYYMRLFEWKVGVEHSFRVAHDQENLIFRAKAIRKERISTDAGEFDAIVVKPEMELKGKYKPVGDIYMWLSDDDRKFILRIESKIKIGTLVSEVIEIQKGLE